MKVNGFYIFLLLFLLMLVLSSIYYPLRYLRYLLPLFSLLLYFSRSREPVKRPVWDYFGTFLIFYSSITFYLFIQNLLFTKVSDRFWPNAIFILSPLIFIILIAPFFRLEKVPLYIKTVFLTCIFIFVYEEGSDLFAVLSNPILLVRGLITSEVSTESQLAFVFGFLVVFFHLEGYGKRHKIIAWVFFILSFKRVVIAAVVLSLVTAHWIQLSKFSITRYRKFVTVIMVVFNVVFIKITQILTSGVFDNYILEKTGFSTDRFLMGRKTFYSEAFLKSGSANWFGLGFGKIDDIIFSSYGERMNLHSEILKNYFEFGVIFFVVWLILFYYKTLFSNKSFIYLLFFNVLMLTDNVFIYFDIMFYFYFFVLILLVEKTVDSKSGEHE